MDKKEKKIVVTEGTGYIVRIPHLH